MSLEKGAEQYLKAGTALSEVDAFARASIVAPSMNLELRKRDSSPVALHAVAQHRPYLCDHTYNRPAGTRKQGATKVDTPRPPYFSRK